MSSSTRKPQIIERLLEHCPRPTHIPLGFLEVDQGVYEFPPEPAEILSILTEEFSTEDLAESGVVDVAEDEEVVLTPALASGESFIVMRDAVTNEPYDLLTPAGCLAQDALPVFEVLRDGHTQQLLEQGNGNLIAVFDLEHVVLLRACGVPATMAVGLDDFPLEQVDQFCETFDLSCLNIDRVSYREEIGPDLANQSECHPDDPLRGMATNMMNGEFAGAASMRASAEAAGVAAVPVSARLAFLGWTPLELSNAVPRQLKTVVDHLRQLQRFMRVDADDIGLWEVDEETIERLRFIAERRSAAIFREAMLDAAEDILAGIGQFGKERPLALSPPTDYTSALARLYESAAAGRTRLPGPDQRKEAWRDVQRLLNQQVVEPVRELALGTGDPLQRNLLMGFAELSNLFNKKALVIGEQLSRHIADGSAERAGQLPEDQFKELFALADRLIGMAKVTERCHQPRTTIIESKKIGSTNFPRLPHSD